MYQLKNRVGASNHGQGKRGQNLMTPCGKQSWSGILREEKHDASEGDDTEKQRNQFAGAVASNLHSPLFPAA